MKKVTLISFLFLFVIFSCKKKVTDVNTDYVGNWSGSDSEAGYTINIKSDSKASYLKLKGGSETNVSGKARIEDDLLKIFTKKFKIDQAPKLDNSPTYPGSYLMILDGVEFRCWK